jgi:5-deoxy-glucuronate isomerase
VEGVDRGEGNTARTIYDLVPGDADTKLMVYEVFTPGGNWSSFPPHKHDVDSDEERLLQEVYLYSFEPEEGFALVWLSDDEGLLDEAYAVRDGDLWLIPKGYHTMCVAPGAECSTHAVMAGPTNEWKISFKKEYEKLNTWY